MPGYLPKTPDMRGPYSTCHQHHYWIHYMGHLHKQAILRDRGLTSLMQEVSQREIQGRKQRTTQVLSKEEDQR